MRQWNPDWIVEEYAALKAHFSHDYYDYFKYKGKTKGKLAPRYFSQAKKLVKHEDPSKLIMSNLRLDPTVWLGDITGHQGSINYTAWKRQISSLEYLFKKELAYLDELSLREAIEVKGGHPPALKLFSGKKWSLETFTIFVYGIGCLDYLDKALKRDILWESVGRQTRKYKPFLDYDQEKFNSFIMEFKTR